MKHLHVHVHLDSLFLELRQAMCNEFQQLKLIITQEGIRMSAQMDALVVQVEAVRGVAQSAAIMLRDIRQQIIDAGTDTVKLQELTSALAASELELSEAVANNPDSTP